MEPEVEHAGSESANTDIGHARTRAGVYLDVRHRDARRLALRREVLDERHRRVALRDDDRARQHRVVAGRPDLLEHERLLDLDAHRDVNERAPRRPERIRERAEGAVGRNPVAGSDVRPDQLGIVVEIYKKAFPDMHRELFRFYVSGDDVVVVQLALQGTHLGPLSLPEGTIPPTGKRMDAPCCDVFELSDGKIKRFDCYPEASIILKQLGVLADLQAVLQHG